MPKKKQKLPTETTSSGVIFRLSEFMFVINTTDWCYEAFPFIILLQLKQGRNKVAKPLLTKEALDDYSMHM